MLNIILIGLLILGFLAGIKRGLIRQLVHLISFAAAFLVAYSFNDQLAPRLKLIIPFPEIQMQGMTSFLFEQAYIEEAFYRMIGFAILFFGTKLLLGMVGSMLHSLAQLPVLKQLNRWGGGILGFAEVYLVSFVLLYIGAIVPVNEIQEPIQQSFMAMFIVNDTPILSSAIQDLWRHYYTTL
ncbi:putative membrane protein required for colicin V production [Bacillus fengqiuensis]|nr:putative membrane protein required for colicin V production [Bacillus fengqiuensis]